MTTKSDVQARIDQAEQDVKAWETAYAAADVAQQEAWKVYQAAQERARTTQEALTSARARQKSLQTELESVEALEA